MKDDHRSLYTKLLQLRKESLKKNSALYGIPALDLYDTSAALYQPTKPTGSRSLNVLSQLQKFVYGYDEMIILHLILHCAVHIYDFHIFIT